MKPERLLNGVQPAVCHCEPARSRCPTGSRSPHPDPHRRPQRAGSARAEPRSGAIPARGPAPAPPRSRPARLGRSLPAPATRWCPRLRSEQLTLVTQGVDLTDRRGTIGDDRQIGQHPTTIMHRPKTGPSQRRGQRAGQPHPIGRQPQQSRSDMRHNTVPTHFHGQALRPRGNIHRKSASHANGNKDLEAPYPRSSQALSRINTPAQQGSLRSR
jgi:hypothetical protein